ncbi:helix-turn-helix domain-containing protein [Salinispira pacifica]
MTSNSSYSLFSVAEGIAAAGETERATGIPCALVDRLGKVLYPVRLRDYPCWMCRLTEAPVPERSRIAAAHAERARQTVHPDGYQIFLCSSNLMHWVVPIRIADRMVAALVGGPVRIEEGDTDFEQDVLARIRRSSEVVARAEEASLRRLYRRIPVVESVRIESLALQLSRIGRSLSSASGGETGIERLSRESRIGEYLQELKAYRNEQGMQADIPTYPLDREQALLVAIGAGDGERAQALLNELLGHVFFSFGADLERIKMRAREIVVLLSRIVIARGADANRVFGFNYRALDELDGLDDLNDVAHWMARIVRGFTDSVLRLPAGAVHTRVLRRVIDYVEGSYRERVSLAAAAGIAGVSAGYLSRIFSAEMGESFTGYVRRMRVQRAQDLLTGTRLPIGDIAELCGFADQSHLTLAFRRETGTTPAEFRKRG